MSFDLFSGVIFFLLFQLLAAAFTRFSILCEPNGLLHCPGRVLPSKKFRELWKLLRVLEVPKKDGFTNLPIDGATIDKIQDLQIL